MPRPRKRTYRRRKRRGRRRYRATPSRNLGPLAVTQRAKLIYHESFLLDPAIGGLVSSYVFSANGCFDPNISGVGHQPRGFDQMMTLYDHCTVIGMKATIMAANQDNSYSNYFAAQILDGKASPNNPQDILENRFVKYRLLAVRTGGSANKTMSIACNPNKFLGKSNPMSCDELQTSISSNPTEQAYLHIHAFSASPGVNSGAVNFRVRIEYNVIFHEPKQPPAS